MIGEEEDVCGGRSSCGALIIMEMPTFVTACARPSCSALTNSTAAPLTLSQL